MMPCERFLAWRRCHELALLTYRVTRAMPREERYGITAQIRGAAFSSAANIAEGAAKRGQAELRRFLDIALGSLAEVGYWILVIRDLELLPADRCDNLATAHEAASKTTYKLCDAVTRRLPSSRSSRSGRSVPPSRLAA